MKRALFTPTPKILVWGFIPVFILLTAHYAGAADLTLGEAMKESLKNNPDILIAKDRVKQAELKVKEAKKRFAPNLSIHAGYNVMTNREGLGFQISQDLDKLLGSNTAETDNALLDLDIARQQLILTTQRITKEVTNAYYNLEFAKDNLKLKENIFNSRYKSLEFAKVKFDLCKISIDELLSKQKEVEDAKIELVKARFELKKEKLNLSQLIEGLK